MSFNNAVSNIFDVYQTNSSTTRPPEKSSDRVSVLDLLNANYTKAKKHQCSFQIFNRYTKPKTKFGLAVCAIYCTCIKSNIFLQPFNFMF